jgi:hypothetical protein
MTHLVSAPAMSMQAFHPDDKADGNEQEDRSRYP